MKPPDGDENKKKDLFVTTRWTLVREASNENITEEERKKALEHLCKIYLRSVLNYVQRQGRTPEEAEDITQDFFLHIMSNQFFQKADPDIGRFRAWLLQSLKNFLSGDFQARSAEKRGGKQPTLSLDELMGESPSTFAPPENVAGRWDPEKSFDIHWAIALLERSLGKLQKECVAKGRERAFLELKPYLQTVGEKGNYEQASAVLGLKTENIRVMIHRMRVRLGEILRGEVLETVGSEAEVDGEMRYLSELLGMAY